MRQQKFIPLFTGLALLVSIAARESQAGTISINPSLDNTLIQATNPAAQLSNGQGDIFVGRTNQDGQGPATISIRRGLVKFDIAGSIPANATITSVKMTMRDVMGLNGNPAVDLHRTLADWGEGTSFQAGGMGDTAKQNDATWLYTKYNFSNPSASTPWLTPGGDFSPTVSGSVVVSAGPVGQVFTWDSATNPLMINDLQFWLDHPTLNYGWLMQGNEAAGQTAKRLNSGESILPPNLPPVMLITFDEFVPPPPAPEPGTGLAACLLFSLAWHKRRRK